MNKIKVVFLVLVVCSVSLWATQITIENYRMTNHVNDVAFNEDGDLWVATRGGLAKLDYDNVIFTSFFHNPDEFPDISLTALCYSEGTLWIGTESGILYKRSMDGQQEAFHDLEVKESEIKIIKNYNDFLLIGHTSGISLFDKSKGIYLNTATKFANQSGKTIVDIKVYNNTLYALYSGSKGTYIKLDNFEESVQSVAFITSDSWKVESLYDTTVVQGKNTVSLQVDPSRGLIGFEGPSIINGDSYIYSNDSILYEAQYVLDTITLEPLVVNDSLMVLDSVEMRSSVTSLSKRGSNEIVTGLEEHVICKDPFNKAQYKYTNGLRKNSIQKLFLTKNRTLWTLPTVNQASGTYFGKNEIVTIKGDKYGYFGNWTKNFGELGRSVELIAIDEGPDGAMWIGSSSDHVKRYKNGNWERLILSTKPLNGDFNSEPPYFHKSDGSKGGWMKVDGLHVRDDNVVFGTYWHYITGQPLFWVYDVKTGNYRYWGEMRGDDPKPKTMLADNNGHMLMRFGPEKERERFYWVLNGKSNFFDSTALFESHFLFKDTLSGEIQDVAVSNNGTYLVGNTNGIEAVHFKKDAISPKKNSSESVSVSALTVGQTYEINEKIENTDAVEYDTYTRTDIWVGVKDSGVVSYYLKEYLDANGEVDSVAIEEDKTFSMIFKDHYFVATSPKSMVYDTTGDYLWVAGDEGLSKFVFAYNSIPKEDNSEFYVYPNPYRKSEHEYVTLKNVAKDAYVDIYTSSGRLVDHISRDGNTLTVEDEKGIYYFRWKPSEKLAPGTYFVIAKNEERTSVVLQKLLILP